MKKWSMVVLSVMVAATNAAAQDKATPPPMKAANAKICLNCHKAEEGSMFGSIESVAFKAHSVQLRIDDAVEIIKFDESTTKVVNGDKQVEAETLRTVKKGHEVRIAFTEKNGVRTDSVISIKPPVKISEGMLISTADREGYSACVAGCPGCRFGRKRIHQGIGRVLCERHSAAAREGHETADHGL